MVWRRLVVPGTCTLHELHGVIQVAMGESVVQPCSRVLATKLILHPRWGGPGGGLIEPSESRRPENNRLVSYLGGSVEQTNNRITNSLPSSYLDKTPSEIWGNLIQIANPDG